jgi:hypothetical protein
MLDQGVRAGQEIDLFTQEAQHKAESDLLRKAYYNKGWISHSSMQAPTD